MNLQQFIQILERKSYAYRRDGQYINVTHERNVHLESLTALPDNVHFNNEGHVYPESLTAMPDNVQFNNKGYVDLLSLKALPDNVQFNNEGDVYLHNLTAMSDNMQFNNKGHVFLGSLKAMSDNIQFNNRGSVSLESLTALPDNVQFNNAGPVYLRRLTALPNNVQFNNEGYVCLGSLTTLPQLYRGEYHVFRTIDGITSIIEAQRNVKDVIIHRARYFRGGPIESLERHYIAEKDGVFAHGKTVREAQRDLRFKLAQADYDADDLIAEVKRTQKITWVQFRLLTGACEDGLRQGLISKGFDPDIKEMPLEAAMEHVRGQYGEQRMRQAFEQHRV